MPDVLGTHLNPGNLLPDEPSLLRDEQRVRLPRLNWRFFRCRSMRASISAASRWAREPSASSRLLRSVSASSSTAAASLCPFLAIEIAASRRVDVKLADVVLPANGW